MRVIWTEQANEKRMTEATLEFKWRIEWLERMVHDSWTVFDWRSWRRVAKFNRRQFDRKFRLVRRKKSTRRQHFNMGRPDPKKQRTRHGKIVCVEYVWREWIPAKFRVYCLIAAPISFFNHFRSRRVYREQACDTYRHHIWTTQKWLWLFANSFPLLFFHFFAVFINLKEVEKQKSYY